MLRKAVVAGACGFILAGFVADTALAEFGRGGDGRYEVIAKSPGKPGSRSTQASPEHHASNQTHSGTSSSRQDPFAAKKAAWRWQVEMYVAQQTALDVAHDVCLAAGDSGCVERKAEAPGTLLFPVSSVEETDAPPRSVGAVVSPAEAGARAVARLRLPSMEVEVGPDPAGNEWGMIPVGYPMWLFLEGETSLSDRDEVGGLSVELVAELESVSFDLGDGASVSCDGAGVRYEAGATASGASPSCGHTYERVPSGGSYRVKATAHWVVRWSASGESGVVRDTTVSSVQVPVGELQVIITE